MFTHLTNPAKAFLFWGIALALTLSVSLLAPILGEATLLIHMYTPTLSVLLMLLVVTRDGYSRGAWRAPGLNRAGLRSWPLALLGPLALLSVVYGVVWSTGIARAVVPAEWTLAAGVTNVGLGLAVSSALALGEEIGFRGYLLPRLMHLGTTRALLLSGLLHGIWHFPVMLLTPFFPILGTWLIIGPVILMTLTAAGVFYGYLQLTSGSVWPTSLAHGALNTLLLGVFPMFTVAVSPLALEYLAGETGVLTFAATAAAAVWLLYRMRQRSDALALQPQAGV